VLAVFFEVGAHNDALDPILKAATTSLTSPGSSTTIPDSIHLDGLLPSSLEGWYYQGSLTTPPLSLPVEFFVFATPITLDAAQLAQYESVANGAGFLPNARPIQPLDGRRLNELNYNVDFKDQSITGLNFGFSPAVSTTSDGEVERDTSPHSNRTGGRSKGVHHSG
jgi:carbonic anhydrase